MTTSWRDFAACRGVSTAIFYPEETGRAASTQARTICRTCPVQTDCLTEALDNNEPAGIWGGLTPPSRRVIRKQQRVLAARRTA